MYDGVCSDLAVQRALHNKPHSVFLHFAGLPWIRAIQFDSGLSAAKCFTSVKFSECHRALRAQGYLTIFVYDHRA